MNARDPYETWKDVKQSISPPPGFADRVMQQIHAGQASPRMAGGEARAMPFRYAAAAAIFLGLAAVLLRLASVAAVVLMTPSKGI